MADQTETTRNERKTRTGTVVSTKMDKTIVVAVERRTAHPIYGKQMLRTKKFHAHDEDGQARDGDTVRIMETRPLSKTKRWRLIEVVMRAE
jgi:small subunit ribosomal protein S17